MKRRGSFILSLFFLCFSSIQLVGQKPIKQEKLLSDYDYLVQELRLQHDGLYNYQPKEIVDKKLDSIRATINKPLDIIEFFGKVNAAVALTNEGHTTSSLPLKTLAGLKLKSKFFPFAVRFFNKELCIVQYYGDKNIDNISPGQRIVSINGRTIEQIVNDAFPLIATDGYNETSKYEWFGILFPRSLRLLYGNETEFDVVLESFDGSKQYSVTVPAVKLGKHNSKNNTWKTPNWLNHEHFFEVLNDSIGYLSVPHFSMPKEEYERHLRKVFTRIKQENISYLILDLQRNTGGTEGKENLLYHYLSPVRVKKYSSVTMPKKPYLKRANKTAYTADQWHLKDSVAHRGLFTLQSDYYSNLGYAHPEKDLVFKGKLFTTISGLTFSGGAELSSLLKMTNTGVFVGEETGGVYEGNISGNSQTVKLPNTKITVDIPIMQFNINVNPEERGRGVMPDYFVPQTKEAFVKEENSKIRFIIEELIQENKN